MKKSKIVSVYGYGRFGKLWGDILKDHFEVQVFSRRGLKADEVSKGITITDENGIFECDALFFCVSISAFEGVLKKSQSLFNDDTIFFDTCSVKVEPVKWMQKFLPAGAKIIATHPMFGPDSYNESDEELPMVMSNVSCNEDVFSQWTDFFSNKKLRVEIMSPEEHDIQVAYSQGITHYVGRVLADLDLKKSDIDTLGYRKMLDVVEQTCNDSWQLFLDLQKYNPYTKKMRKDLQNSIKKIYTNLKQ